MDKFAKIYKFLKGIYEVGFYELGTRKLLAYTNKLSDSNFASSVNVGELTAGVGNSVVITLPDSSKFAITLTAADVDLMYNQLQTGGTLKYNGITPTCEIITAAGTELTVTGAPVAPYASSKVVCYINGEGTPYIVDAQTKKVQGFTAETGKQYSVRYYISKPTNHELDVKALFAPTICTAEVKMPVFAAIEGESANTGSLVGYWHIIVPRFQFSGEGGGVQTNQTTPATGVLNGQALAYDNTAAVSCTSGNPSLIYMVYEPINAAEGVVDMVVLGGGEITVAKNATAAIPVRFVMQDGNLAVPLMSDLEFNSAAQGTATVENGVVTGVAAGDTEITITYEEVTPNLSAVCQVTVTE